MGGLYDTATLHALMTFVKNFALKAGICQLFAHAPGAPPSVTQEGRKTRTDALSIPMHALFPAALRELLRRAPNCRAAAEVECRTPRQPEGMTDQVSAPTKGMLRDDLFPP